MNYLFDILDSFCSTDVSNYSRFFSSHSLLTSIYPFFSHWDILTIDYWCTSNCIDEILGSTFLRILTHVLLTKHLLNWKYVITNHWNVAEPICDVKYIFLCTGCMSRLYSLSAWYKNYQRNCFNDLLHLYIKLMHVHSAVSLKWCRWTCFLTSRQQFGWQFNILFVYLYRCWHRQCFQLWPQ